MIFKSFGSVTNEIIQKPFILLYGENSSLINEIEKNIISKLKEGTSFTIKKYQEEYLLQNEDIFNQIINSNNLFGDEEIYIISKTTDKILQIFDEEIAANNNKKIIFLSESLTKKSKVRAMGESSNQFACIACYQDNPEQLQSLLLQKLKNIKISVSREFINSIFEMNSLNRQDINDAIDKAILIKNSSNIDENKLKELFHSSADNNNFEIVNDCLLGNKKNINIALNNIYAQGINFNEILSALKYKANKLLEILESNSENKNINQLVESFKPAIFWKEKNIVKEQLKRWSKPDLERLLDKIFDIEIECKKNYDVSTTILQNFVINISTKTALTKSPLH